MATGPVIFALGQTAIALKALLSIPGAIVSALVALAGYFTYISLDWAIFNQRVSEGKQAVDDWGETLRRAGNNLGEVPLPQLEAQLTAVNKQLEEGGGLSESFLAEMQTRIDELNMDALKELGASMGFHNKTRRDGCRRCRSRFGKRSQGANGLEEQGSGPILSP